MTTTTGPGPILLWDIDDVLNGFMRLWFDRFFSSGELAYEDLAVNPPHELLGITRERYLETLDSCRPDLYTKGPRPEVRRFFERHGREFRHAALSAVPMRFAPDSAQWLLRHFGAWIQSCLCRLLTVCSRSSRAVSLCQSPC